MRHVQAITVASISVALMSGIAQAQSYFEKPIKVTTVAQGGGLDTVIRMIARGIERPLGQQIIIENKASSTYPQDAIAKAPPDGYSLLYYANQLWLGPFIRAKIPYDPLKDFAPISLTVKGPNTVLVTASLPISSVKELVALAKAKPKELNLAWAGIGSSPHMAGLLFQHVTGARFTEVRYKGQGQAMIDLAAGRVHVSFPTISTGSSVTKGGKARVLAVTSDEPYPQLPDVPTVASAGYPYESVSIHALVAPKNTPNAIINRINQEVGRFLRQRDVGSKLNDMGFAVVASSPSQLAKAMKAEMDQMGPVMRAAGIQPK